MAFFPWLGPNQKFPWFQKNTFQLTSPHPPPALFLSPFNHKPWPLHGWKLWLPCGLHRGSNFSNNLRPPETEGVKVPQMLVQTQQTEIKLKQKILRFFLVINHLLYTKSRSWWSWRLLLFLGIYILVGSSFELGSVATAVWQFLPLHSNFLCRAISVQGLSVANLPNSQRFFVWFGSLKLFQQSFLRFLTCTPKNYILSTWCT